MKGENCPVFFHCLGQQPVGFHHNNSVTCFQGHYDIVEIILYTHPYPLHGRLFHCERSISVQSGYPFSKRPVVKTYTDCCPMLFAHRHKPGELFLCLCVVLVEITRIYPDFLHDFCRFNGCFGREMYIGYERGVNPFRPQSVMDFLQRRNVFQPRHGKPYHFGSGLIKFPALLQRCLHIASVRVAHCLDHNRIPASDCDVTYFYCLRNHFVQPCFFFPYIFHVPPVSAAGWSCLSSW